MMKDMGIDLDNIKVTLKFPPEQLGRQIAGAVSYLLRNTKPADLVPGRSDQRACERGSEAHGSGKSGAAAAHRPSLRKL